MAKRYSLGQKIGEGGEAAIHEIREDPELVAKVYHKATATHAAKILAMLACAPEEPMAEEVHCSIAWPRHRAIQNGNVVGFIMPRIRKMRKVLDFYSPMVRLRTWPTMTYRYLVRAGYNLASAVQALHLKGLVIGDINESNAMVTDTALVTLVDTDSFQVLDAKSGRLFRCEVGKPEYAAPEVHARLGRGQSFRDFDRNQHTDCFGLAVLIFQLLMEGTHPENKDRH